MRGRLLNWPAVARFLATLTVAVAIVSAAIHIARRGHNAVAIGQAGTRLSDDDLKRELARCQNLGMTAKDDRGCEAAWRENRRRFFGDGGNTVRPATAPAALPNTGSGPQP